MNHNARSFEFYSTHLKIKLKYSTRSSTIHKTRNFHVDNGYQYFSSLYLSLSLLEKQVRKREKEVMLKTGFRIRMGIRIHHFF
jgi:hypothetical protein